MYFDGILVGLITFFLIGAFHPLVMKGEYHFGKKVCWVFLVAGILSIFGSLYTQNVAISSVFAVLGCTCLWSIKEVFEQIKRVEKGWYPKNPNRK